MPNPVPLATKEEEERRAWVTAHHEVVRLIKDCFGDRFSNNEIFDRLKISRRTGYRALGNDERIGKAPGRKPKISEDKLREIIVYMEEGGCNDVGNVWKHLASKFAPDCNPKTVQDAVKKLGFWNHHSTVKLEPLMNPDGADDPDSQDDEPTLPPALESREATHHLQPTPQHSLQQQQQPPPQQQQQHQQQQQQQQRQQQQQQQQSQVQAQVRELHPNTMPQPQQQHEVVDPAFHHPQSTPQILQQAIESTPDHHVRYILWDLCSKMPNVERYIASILLPYIAPAGMSNLAPPHLPRMNHGLSSTPIPGSTEPMAGKRSRVAICRRCNQSFNRAENTMDNRQCVYHIGAISKTVDDEHGRVEENPEIYMWSCCGGNGLVRGCKLAMHTTKRKRKYGKKRNATDAGLNTSNGDAVDGEDDEDEDDDDDEDETILSPRPHPRLPSQDTPNHQQDQIQNHIESELQDLPSHGLTNHIGILPYAGELPNPFLQHNNSPSSMHAAQPPSVQTNGHSSLPTDVQARLQMPPGPSHQQL